MKGLKWFYFTIGFLLVGFHPSYGAKDDSHVNLKASIRASELATEMFGPIPPEEAKKMALNVGRIGISINSRLNCGRMDIGASIEGEFKQVERQLKTSLKQIEGMVTNPGRLALGIICYYKPNVCSYIRHLSGLMQESINLQFDACQAIDNYIDDQAAKGMKMRRSEAIEACLSSGPLTAEKIRECQKEESRARDLLYPFKRRFTNHNQKLLKETLSLVKKSDNYNLWARLLGEVEIKRDGWWSSLYPKDFLKPDDFASNVLIASRKGACDYKSLESIIGSGGIVPNDGTINPYIERVIREKISKSLVRDLKSLPEVDARRACNSLGESIAELAIKRAVADGRTTLAAALANDAIPDDLKVFYQDRSDKTFSSISAAIKAKDVVPLAKNIRNISHLAKAFRRLQREKAATLSSKRTFNDERALKESCEDELSCESR
jgi:hypothetical protein